MKNTTYLALLAMGLLLIARVLAQLALYASGFNALTADEFGRVVIAALWMRSPHAIWQGPWLPFHTYFIGTALYVWRDMLLVPRAIAFGFGAASLVCMYGLTYALFANRRSAFLSAALLAVNPAHFWLSSVPLTEIIQTTFLLGFLWANVQFFRHKQPYYLFLSVIILSFSNTVRFESWIFSVFFTFQLLILLISSFWNHSARVWSLAIAVTVPWIFPVAWVVGNYIKTGDPLYFLTVNRAFDTKWYGNYLSYTNYVRTFFELDPYTTILSIPAIILCLTYHKGQRAVYWVIGQIVLSFIAFALLQRGQIQPRGNYIRYLALFIFALYPVIAWLIVTIIDRSFANRIAKAVALALVISLIGTWQVRAAFHYVNDPAAEGLRVGQHIRTLRSQHPASASQPILIELNYWQYLAMHVGANDLSGIVYDRSLDFGKLNDSPSVIQTSSLLLPACVQSYHISYVVVRSTELRQIVQSYLRHGPAAELDGYAVYTVPDGIGHGSEEPDQPCPLKIGTGY